MNKKYQQIIDNLTPQQVINIMEKLGIDSYIEKENYLVFPTVCHHTDEEDKSSKLYYYKDTKLFVCYTQCGPMSIFEFLKHYYETRDIEYSWHNNIYGLLRENIEVADSEGFEDGNRYKSSYHRRKNIEYKCKPYDKKVLDSFYEYYPIEWLNDGISKEAMDKFNIRFAAAQNKIVIPHYNIDGDLIGIRTRILNPEELENCGKYMPLRLENKTYNHPLSLNLYGLYENKETIKKRRICYVFESEKAVLQLESFDMDNCGVAVCGSNINKFQIKLLIKECQPQEIVFCLDKEDKKDEDLHYKKLLKICKLYSCYANTSFIYDLHNRIELKDSPTDKGEKIFKELLEERIKVYEI